jgi:hypothetical protein
VFLPLKFWMESKAHLLVWLFLYLNKKMTLVFMQTYMSRISMLSRAVIILSMGYWLLLLSCCAFLFVNCFVPFQLR